MKRLLALLFLAGCAGVAAPPKLDVAQACLPMVTYTADQEKALGAELAAFKPTDPIVIFITDYGAMRAANRACLAPDKGTAK